VSQRLVSISNEVRRRAQGRKAFRFYPDTGDLSRDKYPKHLAFFEAGGKYRQRCIIAANRIGKTEGIGGYETALHLTGLYPDWWRGRRFGYGIKAWAAGRTGQTTRDTVQEVLLGPPGHMGEGMIPQDYILETKKKAGGVPDAIESVLVRHVSGTESRLVFKSYDQGRPAFEGTAQDLVWFDEECDDDVYGEAVVRTMTTDGLVMLTFTPLRGLTDVVLRFMPDGAFPDRDTGLFVISATWDDAPHLGPREKQEILDATQPFLRDARSKGIPHLGAGSIYPVDVESLIVQPFEIGPYWPRAYAVDVGWERTAAIWGALDRDSDVLYLYSEHYVGGEQPPMHAAAIRARGDWIRGVIDPAARGRSQTDGKALFDQYQQLGLDLLPADNTVWTGIEECWMRMTTGRLKAFSNLTNWLAELRLYRRDEKGKIVKDRDHLMDAMRYLVTSGLDVAESQYRAVDSVAHQEEYRRRREYDQGRSESITGY
jgi:phage terminase large subunit-like protein